MEKKTKTFIFAIDGATWDIIDPLIDSGVMPNMAALMKKGTKAGLTTLTPTESPQIWTSIATGARPEKHGIESFMVKVPGTDKTTLPTSNLRRKSAFWNILSSPDYSVGVVGWWSTFPAERVNGFIISDHANYYKKEILKDCLELTDNALCAPEPKETFPESLYREIEPHIRYAYEFDNSRLGRFVQLGGEDLKRLTAYSTLSRDECLSVLKYVYIYDESFRRSGLHALKKFQPDLFAVFLAGVDAVEHHFWKFMEPGKFPGVPSELAERYGKAIENYYIYLDEVLGEFLGFYSSGDRVIILSDHGHGPNVDYGTNRASGYWKIASGTHEHGPDGILLLSGPEFREGAVISGASVLDITPTLLALHGKPVGEDMDGKVLSGAFKSAFLEKNPVSTIETHSPKDMGNYVPVESGGEDEYKNKLRALGYIE
ncbi:MAG: alkaline phosphatase family protein [Nitrospinae bacterium]|nr:alkaline phosphatase family protein [Nitrospinota bacterium]